MSQLAGCRVLIVEDEFFLAEDAAQALREAGAAIVGPVPDLAEAMKQVERDGFDIALLDIKLHRDTGYPVADMLRERNIPFAFITGFDHSHVPERFADVPFRVKPHDTKALVSLVAQLWASRNRSA